MPLHARQLKDTHGRRCAQFTTKRGLTNDAARQNRQMLKEIAEVGKVRDKLIESARTTRDPNTAAQLFDLVRQAGAAIERMEGLELQDVTNVQLRGAIDDFDAKQHRMHGEAQAPRIEKRWRP